VVTTDNEEHLMIMRDLAIAFDLTETKLAGIGADQWDNPTPCSAWNLRQLVNHTIGAVYGMGAAAAGNHESADAVTDFTVDDPAASFRKAADAALEAWPGAFDRMVQVGPHEMPGSMGVQVNLIDTLTHAWDIAKATGQPAELPDAVATAALETAREITDDDIRLTAGFAPAVEIGPGASATDALVAFLGRQP
jgi:uncharacterized protein (TIGR03086 family)